MRAIVHHRFGEPSAVLTVIDLPLPEPGPGQVRVQTRLSPIHNHNLWTIRGIYGFKPTLPAQAGTEAVGVVDARGPGVDSPAIGQRVATGGTFGVWAEYFVADVDELVPVGDRTSDEVAAQLVSMPFSAISLLESLDLAQEDWVVQNAANGTVGRLVAQLAAARGVNVAGLVRRSAAVDELAVQGIGNIFATDSPGWRSELLATTAGGRIAVGVDSVGGEASGQLVSVLSENGVLVVFGGMQSPVMHVPSGDIMFKGITVTGFWSSQVRARMDHHRRAALLTELGQHIDDGDLTLPVEATYGFDAVREATAANAVAGRTGKVLLRP
ncbi:zinc-binding dehydrogenase [Kineococcus sp. GCM10028916]|uniref:zinc-binding dehydrogenase n=1 Tax=Kineococcus sp. GCM10028916 TaxID=3273394 RepID=UPI003639855A